MLEVEENSGRPRGEAISAACWFGCCDSADWNGEPDLRGSGGGESDADDGDGADADVDPVPPSLRPTASPLAKGFFDDEALAPLPKGLSLVLVLVLLSFFFGLLLSFGAAVGSRATTTTTVVTMSQVRPVGG